MYLATEVLGYDFQPDVHTELFDLYIPYDNKKPWSQQSAIKDRMVIWPRGHFKTFSVHVEIIQAIINNPNVRILIMQGSLGVTRTLLHAIKAHFTGNAQGSRFRELFPEFCADRLGNQDSFITPARTDLGLPQATVTCASPKNIKTGQHYDMGFFDDVINESNWKNPKLLLKAQDEFYACVPLIDPGGYKTVTGTRYIFGDLYEEIARKNVISNTWAITIKSCWTDDSTAVRFPQRMVHSGTVREKSIGFTREGLLQIKADDPQMFASQYMNHPIAAGKVTFTEDLMISRVIAADTAPLLSQAVLFIDLASSQSDDHADDSVIIAGKIDARYNMYVVDGIGGQWSTPVLGRMIINMANKHLPMRIMIEHSPAATYFKSYLESECKHLGIVLPLELMKMDNQKDAKAIRISALEGYMRNKRMFFLAGLTCWEKLYNQFIKWPKAPYGHDDYADTVALMAKAYNEMLPAFIPPKRHPMFEMIYGPPAEDDLNKKLMENPLLFENSMGSEFD